MLYFYLHTTTFLFLLSFNVFRSLHNRSSKNIVCCRVLSATLGRSRSRSNFTGSSSDCDSSQNCRLRPTSTPVSTPTAQPCVYHPVTILVRLLQVPRDYHLPWLSPGDVNRPPTALINRIQPAVADDWESPAGQPSTAHVLRTRHVSGRAAGRVMVGTAARLVSACDRH